MTMKPGPHLVPDDDGKSGGPKLYRVGTLTYTKPALAMLFFWLLWGDFCYNLMEAVTPSLMPLKLQGLGASNTEVGLVLGSIPGLVYSILNPIVSFKSDRFRSRWGRRIPFILVTLPFLVLCLIGLAFGDRLGFWLHHHLGAAVAHASPNTVAILTIGALLVAFTFFNTFLVSTFWYLFNDVVPEHLLARFMSWFRMISLLSGALYDYCIFQYADNHSAAILVGAALLYFVGFGLMCFFVKEGEYPPPPPYVDGKTGLVPAIKTFAVECHFTPHYWYQWLICFFGSISGSAGAIGSGVMTAFGLFFYMAIGLNKAQMGNIFGTVLVASAALILVSGWLADRYHPIRVVIAGSALGLFVVTPVNFIWLFWHPSSNVAYWVCMAMGVGLMAPANALNGVYDPPLLMRLFPKSRYGQFCSTNAIWRTIGGIIGGTVAGMFLDFMTRFVGKEQAYFYIPLWQFLFGVPSFWLLLKMYQSWKKLGGDQSYMPPVMATSEPLVGGV
jgi:MFS family permease